MIRRLRLLYCRLVHTSPRHVQGLWGPRWTCRACGLVYEHAALDGPVKRLPIPQSVRLVTAPRKPAKVRAIAR